MSLESTVLEAEHVRLGARLGEFAGWRLPINYPPGILAEHAHTRSSVSLFDTCHMGELRVGGRGASRALDRLLARAVADQPVGTCRYNFLLTLEGTVRDDLLVYRLAAEEFYLVVNAGTRAADAAWLAEQLPSSVSFADESAATGKIDVQGPATFDLLAALGISRAAVPPYYRWAFIRLHGKEILLSRTGYTGELGVEFYLPAESTAELWRELLRHAPAAPAGLGARDTLRLEMGLPLYGHELDTATTPSEAGFGRLIHLAGRDVVGAERLGGVPRKRLTGFALAGRGAARAGADILDGGGAVIGTVTSGGFGPSVGHALALGYVRGAEALAAGTSVSLGKPGGRPLPATVVGLPFYRHGSARSS